MQMQAERNRQNDPGQMPPLAPKLRAPKKKLIRRARPDRSQLWRRSYQAAFVLLNVWIGGIFYTWVQRIEAGEAVTSLPPAGVEGWLPIAGLMNLKYMLVSGHVPEMRPAAMFLLATFLSVAFFLRKAFCSWLCPVGTVSEYLGSLGKWVFGRNFVLWRWIDLPLRGLKYLLLGFFVCSISTMSADAIAAFMRSDYGVVAAVKMLNFFRYLSTMAIVVLVLLGIASLFVKSFWCRYLCPYGALLGLASLASPLRIRREAERCIDCGKCARVCPSVLQVDKLVTIKSAECTGCLECVAVCPAEGALHLALPKTTTGAKRVPAWAVAAGIAVLFLGIVGFAKAASSWNSPIPAGTYQQLVPHASEARHPMPGDPELSR
jgi:polyferredoxin